MPRASRSSEGRLFTIGYEGKTMDEYLAQLRDAGVSLLCDVRYNAVSRKRGFSKRGLAEACTAAGIRYEHLRTLGIPSEERRNLRRPEDRAALFDRYARVTLAAEGEALANIAAWIKVDCESVALTCFERDPRECHRHCVADALHWMGTVAAVHL